MVRQLAKKGEEVVVGKHTLALIEKERRNKKADGVVGLSELQALKTMADQKLLGLRFSGEEPRFLDRFGREEADREARELAQAETAQLLTCSKVNAQVAEALGIQVAFLKTEKKLVLNIAKFFDDHTMSVHIKDGLPVFAKKGKPGAWQFTKVSDKVLTTEEVEDLSRDIVEKAKQNPEAFMEIEKEGATVVQYENYRIVLASPPFSKGVEITAVRPVVKLHLDDYKIKPELMTRLEERAEGIVIAGAPGAGKSTFAQALAEFYARKQKIVKTIEHPRDLNVMKEITQYGHLEGDPEGTGEVLLLARPDFTVYDELRKTRDFEVYSDMRLAGVGMIGVVHASKAIDTIHRFLGRLEMGVIPQVLDTVIFLKAGTIENVFELEMTVKVPAGMTEADLARPVVEVKDFFTKQPMFEIYTFGEETSIIPVKDSKDPIREMAGAELRRRLKDMMPGHRFEVEVQAGNSAVIYTDHDAIPKLIGRGGANVQEMEKQLGVGLDIRDINDLKKTRQTEGGHERPGRETGPASGGQKVAYDLTETGSTFNFFFDRQVVGRQVDFHMDNDFLFSAVVSKKGKVKVAKKSELGEALIAGKRKKARLEVRV